MWDFDSLIGKAEVYFQRAEAHPHADDDEFTLWLLLGLEFLLRAPLAKVHPTLLAAPEGNAILHAAGIQTDGDPKSIPTHTVIDRLSHVVGGFDRDLQEDARKLAAVRNSELHSGAAALASIKPDVWLPKFMRVAEVISSHLGASVDDLVGSEVAALGRTLVDAEDKRLKHEVEQRIAARAAFFSGLQEDEIEGRRWAVPAVLPLDVEPVPCPACSQVGRLDLELARVTNETVVDDEFVREMIMVARRFDCSVCGLLLEGTAEAKYAGLEQQYVRQESESFFERMMQGYVDDDYGND